jgi:hypothetical protein
MKYLVFIFLDSCFPFRLFGSISLMAADGFPSHEYGDGGNITANKRQKERRAGKKRGFVFFGGFSCSWYCWVVMALREHV